MLDIEGLLVQASLEALACVLEQDTLSSALLGCIVQSVTCLTADPGVASWILARSHTFMEIDHEMISTVILLSSADSRRVVVSYRLKHVHKVLVNRLVKLVQEKSVVRLTDHPHMAIAVDWDFKHQTKPNIILCLVLFNPGRPIPT